MAPIEKISEEKKREFLSRFGVPKRLHDSCEELVWKPEEDIFEARGPKWHYENVRGHCVLSEDFLEEELF